MYIYNNIIIINRYRLRNYKIESALESASIQLEHVNSDHDQQSQSRAKI